MNYVLLDQNDEIIGYSDFPVEGYTHTESHRDGTRAVRLIRCEPNEQQG
jgi:hypothetical protein